MTDEVATRGRSEQRLAPAALPSKSLALVCVLHAAPLLGAALTLPWKMASWFTLSVGALAALHASVAVLALLRRERALIVAWRILTACSVLFLLGVSVVIVTSALYLVELYRSIGSAISIGLFAFWALFVLFTIPISIWGIQRVGLFGRAASLRGARIVAAVCILLIAGIALVARGARADAVRDASSSPIADVARRFSAQSSGERRSLFHVTPAECPAPVRTETVTLLVTTLDRAGKPFAACLQAPTLAEVAEGLQRHLAERALPGAPTKLDLVKAVHALRRTHPLIDALKVRPALDGICGAGRCLAPWQLVALDAFTSYRPLPAVKDASFGCSLDYLAQQLRSPAPRDEQLARIETESLWVHAGEVTPLLRLRPRSLFFHASALRSAVERAERHIVSAQQGDGSFRYLLDPFSGRIDEATTNLPRQAGTTLILCEVGRPETTATIVATLDMLATHERRLGERSALSTSRARAQLGHTALPLVAFASCRARAGDVYDALIGRMARLLLTIQREDGAFHPEVDLRTGKASGLHTPLYAAGQGVLALVLVEALARQNPGGPFPSAGVLREGVERAMNHYSRDYWPRALRPLFFLEENWHCLAARAAIPTHRHEEYERFCLDYVAFKSRLILRSNEGADPEHVGGYSLSNMLPPHSTATAGFGEALAAAIAVKNARGEDVSADRELMREVLGFVLRQQWTAEACFACAGPDVVGGFSETSASPFIRIDFVQHAMAALAHGSRALALGTP